ncbi:MAG: hypothetical protein JSU69_02080, partial [Candidatus Zixiibacteriota bacterium]
MRRKIVSVVVLVLGISALAALPAMSQAPNTISYQGRLTDDAGDPITSQVSVTFSIYADLTGGSALYTQTLDVTPDQNGVFTVELGPIGAAAFDGTAQYLGIEVGTEGEMTPRQVLTSAPYSMYTATIPNNSVTTAKIAPGAVTNSDLGDNAVTGAKVSNGSLYDTDLGDEPGIGSNYGSSSYVSLTSTDVNLTSVTITAPTTGYVIVLGSAYYVPSHVSGTKDLGRFSISRASATLDFGYLANVSTPANATTDSDMPLPVALHRTDTVIAGTVTYYFVADAYSGSPRVSKARLTAMFFPTAYGTVSPPKASPVG